MSPTGPEAAVASPPGHRGGSSPPAQSTFFFILTFVSFFLLPGPPAGPRGPRTRTLQASGDRDLVQEGRRVATYDPRECL